MYRPIIALIVAGFAVSAFAEGCSDAGGQCSIAAYDAAQPVLRGELDAAIHDYLVTHPEVLVEVQRSLLKAKVKSAIEENRAALVADAADPEMGNPNGDVTIVEFFDNQCPFCKLLAPSLAQLVASDPNLRVVLKEFPILGPGSDIAARYALAAKRQGKYAPFHAALMADATPETKLDESRILEIATSLDLDLARLKADIQAPEIMDQIQRDRALAQMIGVMATPGLVIGDTVRSGAMPLDVLTEAIRAARAGGERN